MQAATSIHKVYMWVRNKEKGMDGILHYGSAGEHRKSTQLSGKDWMYGQVFLARIFIYIFRTVYWEYIVCQRLPT